MHSGFATLLKVLAVAVAIGLDVLAISISVGVSRIAWQASLRLGLSFAAAEIAMQVLGYELGSGAGRLLGDIAAYAGFLLLAAVGAFMVRESFRHARERAFDPTRGAALLAMSLSISLDSLGVGFALPAVGIPLPDLLVTVSITTVVFTLIGLRFGAKLGERYEHDAERAAGIMLIGLAILFAIQHAASHRS
jgi:putative Mn2+ efflux pump MntP